MNYAVTFFVVFGMTMFMIHLGIHCRLWLIENANEIYYKLFTFNKIVKYKFLVSIVNLNNSIQSNGSDGNTDEGTLGYLIFSMINGYVRKIRIKIVEKILGSNVVNYYLCNVKKIWKYEKSIILRSMSIWNVGILARK
jgi:hypothetical protein